MSRVANSNPAMVGAAAAGNPLTRSDARFRQQAARQRVTTYDGHTWEYFDCGKPSGGASAIVEAPLVCLPGTSGSPRCFHLQLLALADKGFRVIAVSSPTCGCDESDSRAHSLRRCSTRSCGPTTSGSTASTGSSTRSTCARCTSTASRSARTWRRWPHVLKEDPVVAWY